MERYTGRVAGEAAVWIGLEVVQLEIQRIAEWLSAGKIDAAVGDLRFVGEQGRRHKLSPEAYSCLIAATHPRIIDTFTLDDYLAAKHVVGAPFSGHNLIGMR
jgi:hypothetical protein